jgi:hypothetical protein
MILLIVNKNNEDMKEQAIEIQEQIQKQISLNKQTLEQGKQDLLNKSLDETKRVIETLDSFDNSFSESMGMMLIELDKEMKSEDEQD